MNAPIRPPSPENASPERIFRAILATDFRAFVEYVFGLLRPGTPFKPNWHIDAMTHKVSQVAYGEIKRLIITVPPRHLKSIIASVALPAWYLGHNPSERVVCVSYSAELAKTHANDFRRVVTDPTYQAVFPKMRLARETDSEIHTTLRGRRYATSIQGTLTGRGGNLFVIDDPLKPADAVSEVNRERVIEWYRSTLVTRPDDKQVARIMVVMQRIDVDDLVGYLLENEPGYEVLNLPSIAQSTTTYDLGGGRIHTREKGDLLHPAHESVDVLRQIKKSMGSMLFSAQYQQSPEPAASTGLAALCFQEVERSNLETAASCRSRCRVRTAAHTAVPSRQASPRCARLHRRTSRASGGRHQSSRTGRCPPGYTRSDRQFARDSGARPLARR